MELPPCATPECKSVNKFRVWFGAAWRCGDCVNKVTLARREAEAARMADEKRKFDEEIRGLK